MALDSNRHDLHQIFFKSLQFFANASLLATASSRRAQSFRHMRMGHCHEMRTSVSSSMLSNLGSNSENSGCDQPGLRYGVRDSGGSSL